MEFLCLFIQNYVSTGILNRLSSSVWQCNLKNCMLFLASVVFFLLLHLHFEVFLLYKCCQNVRRHSIFFLTKIFLMCVSSIFLHEWFKYYINFTQLNWLWRLKFEKKTNEKISKKQMIHEYIFRNNCIQH